MSAAEKTELFSPAAGPTIEPEPPVERYAAIGAAFELLRHELNDAIQGILTASVMDGEIDAADIRREIERIAALQRLLDHLSRGLECAGATVELGALSRRLDRECGVEVAATLPADAQLLIPAPIAALIELMLMAQAYRREQCSVRITLQRRDRAVAVLGWRLVDVAVPGLRRPLWRGLARAVGAACQVSLAVTFEADSVVLRHGVPYAPSRGETPPGDLPKPLRQELTEVVGDGDVTGISELLDRARREGSVEPALLDHMQGLLDVFALDALAALLKAPPK